MKSGSEGRQGYGFGATSRDGAKRQFFALSLRKREGRETRAEHGVREPAFCVPAPAVGPDFASGGLSVYAASVGAWGQIFTFDL